jgi:hypothetical protein
MANVIRHGESFVDVDNQVRVAFEPGQNASRIFDKLLNVAHLQSKAFDVS